MPPPELLGCGSPTLAGTVSGNITAIMAGVRTRGNCLRHNVVAQGRDERYYSTVGSIVGDSQCPQRSP